MFINYLHRSGEMRSRRRWHTRKWYHPSPQQRYFGSPKAEKACKGTTKKANVQVFSEKNVFLRKKIDKSTLPCATLALPLCFAPAHIAASAMLCVVFAEIGKQNLRAAVELVVGIFYHSLKLVGVMFFAL